MMQHIKSLLENKTLLLLLAVLYSCGITVLFFIPTDGLPRVNFSSIDKVVHVAVFIILILIWQLYVFRKDGGELSWRKSFLILLSSLIYGIRSEEHTSELQSRPHLVCRLLLEKKKKKKKKKHKKE